MPRPRANACFHTHPGVWCSYIAEKFIAEKPENSLPRRWGRNATQRYASAAFVAYICVKPDEVELAPDVFGTTAHLHNHFAKQVWFATLYAAAPDYCLSLMHYVRTHLGRQSQVAAVARIMSFEGEKLLLAHDGTTRLDKEIAAELKDRPGQNFSGMDTSIIGKARRFLAELAAANNRAKIARFMDVGIEAEKFLAEQRGRYQAGLRDSDHPLRGTKLPRKGNRRKQSSPGEVA